VPVTRIYYWKKNTVVYSSASGRRLGICVYITGLWSLCRRGGWFEQRVLLLIFFLEVLENGIEEFVSGYRMQIKVLSV